MRTLRQTIDHYLDQTKHKKRDFRDRLEIAPEKAEPGHSVCSIGKSAKDGKWYGWSHRAYYGFKTKAAAKKFADSVG